MGKSGNISRRKDVILIRSVAGNIVRFRLKKGMSQEELREKTGIEIARCESGKYDMTLTTIGLLAKYLHIEPWQLLR